MKRFISISGAILSLFGNAAKGADSHSPLQFTDVTADSGIEFIHDDGSEGQRYIVESVASGMASFDYDGDGKIDLLFLNGAPLSGQSKANVSKGNALYRNTGNWRFENVTQAARLNGSDFSLGVCVGDYNSDGFPDVFISNFGADKLYRNEGNGTFTDVTQTAGVANGDQVGAGAAFLDIEGDGDLDLFVANYCGFQTSKHQARRINGYPAYSGPALYGPLPDTLFRNNGDGTFSDISKESGVAALPGNGMGVVCADYDADGDTDIIVGNDAMANFVWRNDRTGKFKEVGLFSGLAYDSNGVGLGTMGVECGDYDNDGLLDFYMTSYEKQWGLLYRNEGHGFFADITQPSGAGTGTFSDVTWGVGMVDFDNDSFRDLFIACGHLQDNIQLWDDTKEFEAENILLRSSGGNKFTDHSAKSGDGLRIKKSSRGAIFEDLDNDGDIDAVVLNTRERPSLLRNDAQNSNHWIQIRLHGKQSNREGIGAQIKIVAGGLSLVDEVRSGRSYQSHYGLYPHFGLGQHDRIDRIHVKWLGGGEQIVEDVAVDQLLEIHETPQGR